MTTPNVLKRDESFESEANVMPYIVREELKGVYTAMHGIIVSYDATTRLASVQPGTRLLTLDGTLIERAIVYKVPILATSVNAGRVRIEIAPVAGDSVFLLYSMRSLVDFKSRGYEGISDPIEERLFDERDCVAIPGFPQLLTDSGITEGIKIVADGEEIRMGSNGIRLTTSRLEHEIGAATDPIMRSRDISPSSSTSTVTLPGDYASFLILQVEEFTSSSWRTGTVSTRLLQSVSSSTDLSLGGLYNFNVSTRTLRTENSRTSIRYAYLFGTRII